MHFSATVPNRHTYAVTNLTPALTAIHDAVTDLTPALTAIHDAVTDLTLCSPLSTMQ